MSQTGGGSPIGGPGQSQSIPTPSKFQPYHWWFDRNQTGVFNSSPPANPQYPNSEGTHHGSFSSASSPGTSYGSPPMSNPFPTSPPDPKVAIPMPAPGDEMKYREFFRRSSLKNMYLLDDFGTPPE